MELNNNSVIIYRTNMWLKVHNNVGAIYTNGRKQTDFFIDSYYADDLNNECFIL